MAFISTLWSWSPIRKILHLRPSSRSSDAEYSFTDSTPFCSISVVFGLGRSSKEKYNLDFYTYMSKREWVIYNHPVICMIHIGAMFIKETFKSLDYFSHAPVTCILISCIENMPCSPIKNQKSHPPLIINIFFKRRDYFFTHNTSMKHITWHLKMSNNKKCN